jgi:hypothetical protein
MDAHQAEQARIIAIIMDTGEVAVERATMTVGQ